MSPAGYSKTPLVRKLGIKPSTTLTLLRAPEDFDRTLGPLPDDVRIKRSRRGATDLTIWFVRRRRELEADIAKLAAAVGANGIWIAWPKRSSPLASDFAEADVRAAGLAHGLVDFKICAIDEDWSGLKFQVRDRRS